MVYAPGFHAEGRVDPSRRAPAVRAAVVEVAGGEDAWLADGPEYGLRGWSGGLVVVWDEFQSRAKVIASSKA